MKRTVYQKISWNCPFNLAFYFERVFDVFRQLTLNLFLFLFLMENCANTTWLPWLHGNRQNIDMDMDMDMSMKIDIDMNMDMDMARTWTLTWTSK
jgi:hypothetical protein